MKQTLLTLFTFCVLCSFDKAGPEGKAMPLLPGKTLKGHTMNAAYFKGHVTLVNFMYIGCPPCMNEIGAMNRLYHDYAGNNKFQMLCIARQTNAQMNSFNAAGASLYSRIRTALGAEPIAYDILAACEGNASHTDTTGENIRISKECNIIEEIYGVDSYPTAWFVDKNGIVRKVSHGGPASKDDKEFYTRMKKEIDAMLAE